jgi:hypothetical protein
MGVEKECQNWLDADFTEKELAFRDIFPHNKFVAGGFIGGWNAHRNRKRKSNKLPESEIIRDLKEQINYIDGDFINNKAKLAKMEDPLHLKGIAKGCEEIGRRLAQDVDGMLKPKMRSMTREEVLYFLLNNPGIKVCLPHCEYYSPKEFDFRLYISAYRWSQDNGKTVNKFEIEDKEVY